LVGLIEIVGWRGWREKALEGETPRRQAKIKAGRRIGEKYDQSLDCWRLLVNRKLD
jgi:hypothetical protein